MIKMIEKVLIANRGEIALRVIRTCKALGIKTVAVYSDEDRNSMHVKQASEAYHIGEAAPSKSYLNQEKILDVMLSSGTDAVHPGYGFLSENDDFARLCEKNKITFIGPSADSMNLCGDKMKCKAAMLKAEVPTVPGSPGLVKDADDAEKIANDIGYPVMLKSVYGGGGRGIRIVTNDKELRDGYESVTGESIAAVGKSAILVEKYLEKTRHIEYQFARDSQGNAVHIFERECSIQRRNQKLIEQTPSPIVDEETRARIGELVCNAAHAVDYTNLGTAEFLRADSGEFYFIEINARLQVEHPITEMVTGVDLIKKQILMHTGDKIPEELFDLELKGHSIECRINAEDPYKLTPSAGQITRYHAPGGPGIRVDSHVYHNYTVPPYYDSLIGKVIAYGENRDQAIARMRIALSEMVVEGIKTNIPLHLELLHDAGFLHGGITIHYLEQLLVQHNKQG